MQKTSPFFNPQIKQGKKETGMPPSLQTIVKIVLPVQNNITDSSKTSTINRVIFETSQNCHKSVASKVLPKWRLAINMAESHQPLTYHTSSSGMQLRYWVKAGNLHSINVTKMSIFTQGKNRMSAPRARALRIMLNAT